VLLLACGGEAARGAAGSAVTPTIVLDRSIGGVSLGETRGSVERRIGRGFLVSARTDVSRGRRSHVERLAYDAAGLYVTYVSSGGPSREARVAVLETTWPSFRTPQGVHVGSPLTAVRAIPGVRCYASVCQHGYAGRGAASPGTSFLVDPVRRRVVRIVVAFGR